jgi:hypothetical protein
MFSYSDDLAKYFNAEEVFKIDYDLTNFSSTQKISDVPDSVLAIPFLGNVLPISWLCNADLVIPELDLSFYEKVADIKNGYAEMYPNISFKGILVVNNVVNNTRNAITGTPISFFSAGVDAWQTLCEHYNENPVLLTMFGADFYLDNDKGNKTCGDYMKDVAKQFGCKSVLFNSSLRKFINEKSLNERFSEALGFHWWHRIQHGLGVIAHAAPIAYLDNSQVVYFASSYSYKDKVRHKCATDPKIDNHIYFANARVIHDGYEFTRQDKIYNICNFSKKHNLSMFIHVCWGQYDDVHNCSTCEKCMRTWMGILAEGFNPNDFGFKYEGRKSSQLVKNMLATKKQVLTEEMWEQIFNRFKMNAGIIAQYPELAWTLDFDFSKQNYNNHKIYNICGINVKTKNNVRYKVITILGIKIKFKVRNKA